MEEDGRQERPVRAIAECERRGGRLQKSMQRPFFSQSP